MKILKKMKFFIALLLIVIMQFVFMPLSQKAYAAQVTVDLGTAAPFAILANTAITDSPTSAITGNVGLYAGAGSLITGLTCTQVTGTIYSRDDSGGDICFTESDSLLLAAKNDLTTAYTDAAGRTPVITVNTELGGQTLVPGVYASGETTFGITAGAGPLILDGQGDSNAVFIFEVSAEAPGLTVGPGSVVSLANGACASNIFWRVDSAAIDTTAVFKGNILALNSITVENGANIEGRLLARNGQVTLINDTVKLPTTCAAVTSTPTSSSSSSSSSSTSTPICTEFIPTSNPDLFQIDRAGSTAVLHFTPVNNNMTYYYIAYGLSPGSEQYGVTFPASPSTGAVTYTINDLNPNLTYYFKVRAGNICAPGGWSNNRESNSKNPSLPNTGFAPHERSVPGLILIGIFSSACFVYLARKREKFLIKQE